MHNPTSRPTDEAASTIDQHAAELVDAITGHAAADQARDEATFRLAYELGFQAGRDVGYAHRLAEEQRAADAYADAIRGITRGPTYAELEHLRHPHHTPAQLADLRRAAREHHGLAHPLPELPGEQEEQLRQQITNHDRPRDPWATIPPGAAA